MTLLVPIAAQVVETFSHHVNKQFGVDRIMYLRSATFTPATNNSYISENGALSTKMRINYINFFLIVFNRQLYITTNSRTDYGITYNNRICDTKPTYKLHYVGFC